MKRPEKKEELPEPELQTIHDWDISYFTFNWGYNQALDDMDKYLPSEDELISIISEYFSKLGARIMTEVNYSNKKVSPSRELTQAIHKRIRE